MYSKEFENKIDAVLYENTQDSQKLDELFIEADKLGISRDELQIVIDGKRYVLLHKQGNSLEIPADESEDATMNISLSFGQLMKSPLVKLILVVFGAILALFAIFIGLIMIASLSLRNNDKTDNHREEVAIETTVPKSTTQNYISKPQQEQIVNEEQTQEEPELEQEAVNNGEFNVESYSWISQRLITENDINGLDHEQIRKLRNYIFARHGYIFKSSDLREYFSQFSWYTPTSKDVSGQLSGIENRNVQILKSHE